MVKAPNILLITTDQQRFDTAGTAAPSFMRTPHFDLLQREGITFSRAYSDCPICVAARVGIMTGRFVGNHGMMGEWTHQLGDGQRRHFARVPSETGLPDRCHW